MGLTHQLRDVLMLYCDKKKLDSQLYNLVVHDRVMTGSDYDSTLATHQIAEGAILGILPVGSTHPSKEASSNEDSENPSELEVIILQK